MILPESLAAARITAEDYIDGPPELLVEVAASTAGTDLGVKKDAYAKAGVREYLVVRPGRSVEWFACRDGRYEALPVDAAGVVRSEVFAGLWLDAPALLRRDTTAIRAALEAGLATPDHAAFVQRLAAAASPL